METILKILQDGATMWWILGLLVVASFIVRFALFPILRDGERVNGSFVCKFGKFLFAVQATGQHPALALGARIMCRSPAHYVRTSR